MKEYIEREAVEEMLESAQTISDGEYCGYCTEDINLSSIPAADVAPVRHGKWIRLQHSGTIVCGNCGRNIRRIMEMIMQILNCIVHRADLAWI